LTPFVVLLVWVLLRLWRGVERVPPFGERFHYADENEQASENENNELEDAQMEIGFRHVHLQFLAQQFFCAWVHVDYSGSGW
jgi:hypothetical protein